MKQDRIHLLNNGELNVVVLAKFDGSFGRLNPFDHHRRRCQDRFERSASAELLAQPMVSSGETGRDKIAKSAQTPECFFPRTHGDAKPSHLDNAACHQRRFRVRAESKPITHPCSNRDGIF